jgi:hypothetical protein
MTETGMTETADDKVVPLRPLSAPILPAPASEPGEAGDDADALLLDGMPAASIARIHALLLEGAMAKTESLRLKHRLRAAEGARDLAEARLLTLAQSLADALDFKNDVEETIRRGGVYKGEF